MISPPRQAIQCSEEPGPAEGDLLAIVVFADVRWLSRAWINGLLIFERCLVFSRGHWGAWLIWSANEAAVRKYTDQGEPLLPAGLGAIPDQGATPGLNAHSLYAARLAAIASLGVDQIVEEHRGNWVLWSRDVMGWDLRRGLVASRLRLELADGTRRKVLWNRQRQLNSFPVIRGALERALDSPPRHEAGRQS